jgi:hypothetical protein
VVKLEENTLPVVLGVLCFLLLQFLLRVPSAPIVGRVWFLTLPQLTVAATWNRGSRPFLWAGGRPRTTNSEVVACILPTRDNCWQL